MLNRELTAKEKILVLIAAVLALGLFYYNFVYKFFQSQYALYDTSAIENELLAEQNKAMNISRMKQVIADSKGTVKGDLSVYNNQSAEIIEMGRIFDEDADNVSITWSEPVLSGTIIRRDVNITFHCRSYENFKNVLRKMSEMKYRCLIGDVVVSDAKPKESNGVVTSDDINASISVRFFETSEGAASLAGVKKDTRDDGLSGSELEERAHAYENQ